MSNKTIIYNTDLNSESKIIYGNLRKSGLNCSDFDEKNAKYILDFFNPDVVISKDAPDLFMKLGSSGLIIEEFKVDASVNYGTRGGSSKLFDQRGRDSKKRLNGLKAKAIKDGEAHITRKVGFKQSYQELVNNFWLILDKHYLRIDTYKQNINCKDSKICFFINIDTVLPIFLIGNQMEVFLHNDRCIIEKLLEYTHIDYIIFSYPSQQSRGLSNFLIVNEIVSFKNNDYLITNFPSKILMSNQPMESHSVFNTNSI